jgi:hypothetical protein
VITEKTGITSVTLDFPLSPADSAAALVTAPSALASIQGVNLPEDKVLRVHSEAGTVDVVAGVAAALPSAGGEISLSIESPADPKSPVRDAGSDAALISKATYDTEIARDGAALTEGVVTVQHGAPVRLSLQLPDGAEFLQCRVNGEAVNVGVKASGLLEIPLDDPATDGAESEIRLSYTIALKALEISEGEVTLALPQTPWFVRQTDWNLRFPPGFDLAAVGNLDAIPASEAGATAGLHLRKLFARNQRAESRITYRKH